MTNQLELAYHDRHAGQAANLAAGKTALRDETATIQDALAVCAANPRPFTADDVHKLVEHELGQDYGRNRVSSAIGLWSKAHRIQEVPRPAVPSCHRSRNGSRNRWWIGTQHLPEARHG